MIAFGLRVPGGVRPFSDLHLGVYAGEPVTLRQLRVLREAFEESILPMRVDICDGHCLTADLDIRMQTKGE